MNTARGSLTLICYALLALVASNGLWWLAYQHVSAGRASAELKVAALQADMASQRAEFEAKARRTERAQRVEVEGIRRTTQQELTHAETKHQHVVAAMHAGTLRLRQLWQGCTAARVPASAATAADVDAAAELRIQGAGAFVRDAAQCDARIKGLQAYAQLCSGGAE